MTNTLDRTFALGGDMPVARIGFGAMRLTGQPGNFGPYADPDGGKALLRRAVELGTTLIDTAHAYGPGHNEDLIAEALHPYAPGLVIATKGGVGKTGPGSIVVDGRPATLRAQVEESLRRLRLERIDLYQLHRPDPAVPLADSVGALDDLRREGKVRHIGLSNVTREQVEAALAVAPVASVQNRLNRLEPGDLELVAWTAARGIAFLPYGPLGAHPMRPGAPLATGGGSGGTTASQAALLWLLGLSPNVIAIPGTTSPAHLAENIATWAAA